MDVERILRLKQAKNEKIDRAREMVDRAELEKRELSRRESAEYDRLVREIDELGEQIRKGGGGPLTPGEIMGDAPRFDGEAGRAVALRPEQRLADWQREHPGRYAGAFAGELNPDEASLGKVLRGMVTGDWNGAALELRALNEGTDSAGGFLTPEPLAARFLDRVRSATRVVQAGAQTVPMTSDTLAIPRLTGGASVAWKSEGAAIAESDMTFDRVTFTARTLPILVKMSQELFEDMTPEAAAGIENEIAQALSLELDRVALRGSGTAPEPRGIRNQSGITVQSLGANGDSPIWDDVIDGVSNLRALNHEPNALIWASRTEQGLGKLKESTGAYQTPPAVIDGVRRLVSNQIPTNLTVGTSTDCSEVYVADWSQLLIGVRTDLRFQVRVLDQRFAENLQVGLLTYLRADVQLAHPEAFNVMTGVRP